MMGQKQNWFRHLRNEASRTLRDYAYVRGLTGIEAIPLPVPLEDIAERVLRFEYVYSGTMDPRYSGWFSFEERLIRINADDRSPEHQRFTFGHEIGHGRLHEKNGWTKMFRCTAGVIGAPNETTELGIDWSRFDVDHYLEIRGEEKRTWPERRCEIEANVFASALVIPSAHLAKYSDGERRDIHQLARVFGVSMPAMSWRLAELEAETPAHQATLFPL